MGTSLVTVPKPQPIQVADRFTPEQLELIRRTVARDATNDELLMFFHQCAKTGLDPLARQIYFIKRQGKGTIQTGIDGYRLVADRTGQYAGNDDPEFDNEEKPTVAKVTVWKIVAGQRCPFTATARWSQYYPGDQQGWAWKKMPHLMLGKCAEALALRKAFPAELSGVYTHEEMQQADKFPPEGQTEAESIREYERNHGAKNIAKAEGWIEVSGRIVKRSEPDKFGLLWFQVKTSDAEQAVAGSPDDFPELTSIELGDEAAFFGVEVKKQKKTYYELKQLGPIIKPTMEQKLEASVEYVQGKQTTMSVPEDKELPF